MRNLVVFECHTFGVPLWSDAAQAVEMAEPLARALALDVSRNVCLLAEPVARHESYGWAFTVEHDGMHIWCMLQRSDAWLMITEARRTLLDRQHGRSSADAHAAVCGALDAALRRIPGVSNIRWLTRSEFRDRQQGAGCFLVAGSRSVEG